MAATRTNAAQAEQVTPGLSPGAPVTAEAGMTAGYPERTYPSGPRGRAPRDCVRRGSAMSLTVGAETYEPTLALGSAL